MRSPATKRSSSPRTAPPTAKAPARARSTRPRATPVRRRCSPPPHALPDLGTAPEFTETEDWFNTPGDRPLTLASLRGRVVLVDFWTYTCINCIRTLPYLKAWNAAYAKDGLTIVGVEAPEFAFEKDASNVSDAIGQFGLRYPVVQDNNMGTWNAYGNEYWPADYLIDAKGQVRYATLRRGRLRQDRNGDQGAARRSRPPGRRQEPPDRRDHALRSGDAGDLHGHRARAGLDQRARRPARTTTARRPASALALNDFAYSGTWDIGAQPAEAVSEAGMDLHFQAKNVYLVLSSQDERPMQVQVMLDGHPISAADSGADVHDGVVTVRRQRLYWLVSLPGDQSHELELRFADGVAALRLHVRLAPAHARRARRWCSGPISWGDRDRPRRQRCAARRPGGEQHLRLEMAVLVGEQPPARPGQVKREPLGSLDRERAAGERDGLRAPGRLACHGHDHFGRGHGDRHRARF